MRILTVAALLALGSIHAAVAKPALCFSTDDGEYDCNFITTDSDGSFEISAPNRPTFSLIMDRAGVAYGFADFGQGNVSLPGLFLRSRSDPACWVNDTTSARLCAW